MTRLKILIITLLVAWLASVGMRATPDVVPDSLVAVTLPAAVSDSLSPALPPADSVPITFSRMSDNPNFWRNRIKNRSYNIADTTIVYPKFLKFCVNAYNWADRVFNTYDHDYVMPTGKKWKVIWRNSNWTDSYSLDMPENIHIRMISDLFMSMGPSISFMAVGISFNADINRLISGKKSNQKRLDVSFSTALFEVDLYYTHNGAGTNIRRYHPYDQGRWIKVPFPSLQLENYGLMGFYFFNHGRYYQGAAYNYSKIQKRTQGSFILGLDISHQYIDFDLSTLPSEFAPYLPKEKTHFHFSYNDYCVIAGYGINWVFNPHWVFNISGLPSAGVRRCLADNDDSRRVLPAINLSARMGLAYNLQNFFTGFIGSVNARWYLNKQYSFINGVLTFGLAAGLRF